VVEFSFFEEFDDFVFCEMSEADLDAAFVLVETKAECEAREAFVLGGEVSVSPDGWDIEE
jgi:hypothetical protein